MDTVELVKEELAKAKAKFMRFNSPHEGLAVIREEYLELEKWVFERNDRRDLQRDEAIQLAAMAIRFVDDLCQEIKHG